MSFKLYGGLLAKTLRAGVRAIQSLGGVSRVITQPAPHLYHQVPRKAASLAMRFFGNPRVVGGLFMGSFAATAVVSSEPDSSGRHPLLRNPFRSVRPPPEAAPLKPPGAGDAERQERVDAALSKLSKDPMLAWAGVDPHRPAVQPLRSKSAEDASLLEFASLGQTSSPLSGQPKAVTSTALPSSSAPSTPTARARGWAWSSAAPAGSAPGPASSAPAPAARRISEDEALMAFASAKK